MNVIHYLGGYYFAFGHIFINSDRPEAGLRIREHPELPVISEADIESPDAEERLHNAIDQCQKPI